MTVRPQRESTVTELRNRDDAGLTVLGRLLLVAVAAGMIIGGLTAQLLAGWTQTYGAAAGAVGALVGMPVAVLTQTVNAVALSWARRVRPGISRTGMRAVLLPLPTLVAPGTAAIVVGVDGVPSWVLLIGVPTLLTAVTAWAAAPWCLAPLSVVDAAGDQGLAEPVGVPDGADHHRDGERPR